MDAAQRLKEVRGIFHMNQTEFARRTGLTGSLISLVERGGARLTWKTAHIIEEELGISARWLMDGSGEIAADPRRDAAPDLVPPQYPAVAELLRAAATRLTPADWEALNGVCERVLQRGIVELDPARSRRAGA